MIGTQLDTVFEDFIKKLVLTQTQKDRIDTTLETAQDIFDKAVAKMQGSFATGTTVKPLSEHTSKDGVAGEYDADIALLSTNWNGNSETVLKDIKTVLSQHYGSKVDNKKRNSCERVYFDSDNTGVTFHADFVPLLDEVPIKRADRELRHWRESRTFEVIDRYLKFDQENNYATSCLLIFKRLRDYADLGKKLPSIVLLALHINFYQEGASYCDDLILMCNKAIEILKTNNPLFIISDNGLYQLTENLSEKIENKSEIIELLENFRKSLVDLSIDTLEDMQEFLSVEFPTDANQYPIEMESLRKDGLAFDTKNGLSQYEIQTSEHSNRFYKLIPRGMVFTNPVTMKFIIRNHRELNSTRSLSARWRITNDPRKVPNNIRGRLLGRSPNNEFVHVNETAQYEGVHRAEVFVTKRNDNKVIGTGRYKVEKVENL